MVGQTLGLPHMEPLPPSPPTINMEPPEDNIHRKKKKYTVWLNLEEESADGSTRYAVADESYAFEADELTAQDIWRQMDDKVLMEVPEE